MPASPVVRASKMRRSVKIEIKLDANAAPMNACFVSTPTIMNGGAMSSVRAIVQPSSRIPEPLSPSNTRAAVR